MKTLYTLCILLTLTTIACTKSQPDTVSADYVVVGRSGGMVPEDTKASYYIIRDGKVYMDSSLMMSNIPQEMNAFNFNCPMHDSIYKKALTIQNAIPRELLSMNGQSIGNVPFCDQQVDVRARINGVSYRWFFQVEQKGTGNAIQQYVNKLNSCF
ncbi:MAG: hypothetical protein V4649_17760 [Bacteroidota bacterium]